MALHHRIDVIAGPDRPIVRKVALDPTGEAILLQEADRLDRASHPGVVVRRPGEPGALELAWAGRDTLATARLAPDDIAVVLAIVATTVADLHRLGIIHGRLDCSHVIIGGDGRPRLCGMRGQDPGHGREPTSADDVAAIGRLIEDLLDPTTEPTEDRPRRRRRVEAARRTLASIATRATDPDPARRPTARALAAALAAEVGDAPLRWLVPDDPAPQIPSEPAADADQEQHAPVPATPERHARGGLTTGIVPSEQNTTGVAPLRWHEPTGPTEPTEDHPPDEPGRAVATAPPARSARGLAATALLGVGSAVLVVIGLTWHGSSGPTAPPVPPTLAGPSSIVANQHDRTSTTTTTTAPTTGDGTRVDHDGATYVAGGPGDRVAVADWDCDGTATPGLVRPGTGEVFLFTGWASAGHDVTTAPVAVIDGAEELVGPAAGGQCQPARVRLADGSVRSVPQVAR